MLHIDEEDFEVDMQYVEVLNRFAEEALEAGNVILARHYKYDAEYLMRLWDRQTRPYWEIDETKYTMQDLFNDKEFRDGS